jgi:polar amino acid transport system substrate-binding protein
MTWRPRSPSFGHTSSDAVRTLRRAFALLLIAAVSAAAVLAALPAGAADRQIEPVAPLSPETLSAATGGDGRLSIAVRRIEPFAFPTPGGWSGYSIDVWQAAAAQLEVPYDYVEVATVSEQLDAVRTGRTDAALGAISITAEREAEFDFSFPMYDSGLQVLVRPTNQGFWGQMLALFSSTVLFLLLVLVGLLIVVGHIVWLIERRTNDDFPHAYAAGVWEGIWWAIVTMTTIGYGDRTVQSRWGRLVAMVWMLVGLVLVAHFTAVITSALTVDRIRSEVRSVSDLYGRDVVTVADTSSSRYLESIDLPARALPDVDEAYGEVVSGQAEALVFDAPVLRFLAQTRGDDSVEVVGSLVQPQGYGMAFRPGNPLVEPLDLELLALRENGTTEELDSRYFGD